MHECEFSRGNPSAPTADEGFCGTASVVRSWENRRGGQFFFLFDAGEGAPGKVDLFVRDGV